MEPSWLFCQQKCFNTTTYKNFSFIALAKRLYKNSNDSLFLQEMTRRNDNRLVFKITQKFNDVVLVFHQIKIIWYSYNIFDSVIFYSL